MGMFGPSRTTRADTRRRRHAAPPPEPPRTVALRTVVTGPDPESLERAALRRARLFFAGHDAATLRVEDGWTAVRDGAVSSLYYRAEITVWAAMPAGPRERCPRCGHQVPVCGDGSPVPHDRHRRTYPGGLEPAEFEPVRCEPAAGGEDR